MKTYDAIIVLGGGRTNDGSMTELSMQRLIKGAELYKQGVAPKIFALGGAQSTYSDKAIKFSQTAAELRRDIFISQGVKPEDIIMVEKGRDTIGEAFGIRDMAKELGFKKMLLVTSDKHMPRALYIFQRIHGEEFEINPVEVPCGDLLNVEEEKEYLDFIKKFFQKFPANIPSPASWDQWKTEHADLYDAYKAIHAKYMKGDHETNQAYMGVEEKKTS